MRFNRWTNPSLPQTLQYGIFLLYINAGIAVLWALGLPLGLPPYAFLAEWIFSDGVDPENVGRATAILRLIVLVSAAAYTFAGLMIANEQKRGWMGGVAVATGGVIIPLLAVQFEILSFGFLIGFMFDVALLVLLVHPQSRDYQRIWFE